MITLYEDAKGAFCNFAYTDKWHLQPQCKVHLLVRQEFHKQQNVIFYEPKINAK